MSTPQVNALAGNPFVGLTSLPHNSLRSSGVNTLQTGSIPATGVSGLVPTFPQTPQISAGGLTGPAPTFPQTVQSPALTPSQSISLPVSPNAQAQYTVNPTGLPVKSQYTSNPTPSQTYIAPAKVGSPLLTPNVGSSSVFRGASNTLLNSLGQPVQSNLIAQQHQTPTYSQQKQQLRLQQQLLQQPSNLLTSSQLNPGNTVVPNANTQYNQQPKVYNPTSSLTSGVQPSLATKQYQSGLATKQYQAPLNVQPTTGLSQFPVRSHFNTPQVSTLGQINQRYQSPLNTRFNTFSAGQQQQLSNSLLGRPLVPGQQNRYTTSGLNSHFTSGSSSNAGFSFTRKFSVTGGAPTTTKLYSDRRGGGFRFVQSPTGAIVKQFTPSRYGIK